MSACCDGSMGDSCPCECHAWDPVMDGIMDRVADRIRRLMARDFGLEPRVHPLLDPEAPAPVLEADPVPPVDPSMVTWPMDATREVRVGDRLIGYESGGMVHVTDRNAMRALQRGIPLAVSIRPLPAPEWDVAEGWLDPDKLDP